MRRRLQAMPFVAAIHGRTVITDSRTMLTTKREKRALATSAARIAMGEERCEIEVVTGETLS
jgi:hypothetical protein